MSNYWKKCSACKKEIAFKSKHFICSVSTCNQKRTALAFCSVSCWDSHLPLTRHRPNSYAIEKISPSQAALISQENAQAEQESRRRIAVTPAPAVNVNNNKIETDILVVVSKVKKYIKDKADMNTSSSTMEELTQRITVLCDKAIQNAIKAERRTVMERDVPFIKFDEF